MRDPSEYLLESTSGRGEAVREGLADAVYRRVFRVELSQPGFGVLNLPAGTDSQQLRQTMVDLKQALARRFVDRHGRKLGFQSLGRFNQQHTTKPHRDNAPPESVLILGYEPTAVRSRFFIADYTAAAVELGLTPDDFLATHNPMYASGQELLTPYTTELRELTGDRPQIVVVNNSSQSPDPERSALLGVLHHAVIPQPNPAAQRIVNSAMLVVLDESEEEPVSGAESAAFVSTQRISESGYA